MKQRNLNFKQSSSERRADGAYGNFRKEMVRKLKLDKFVSKWNFKKNKFNK